MSIIQENMGWLCVSDMYSAILIQEELDTEQWIKKRGRKTNDNSFSFNFRSWTMKFYITAQLALIVVRRKEH